MTRARAHAAFLIILLAGTAAPARAEREAEPAAPAFAKAEAEANADGEAAPQRDGAASPEPRPHGAPPGWRYLVDGGAVPFLYGSAAAGLVVELWTEPRSEPLWFDDGEGGAPRNGDTVPSAAVGGVAALGLVAMAAVPAPGRWYHVKGLGESLATTWLATSVAKNVFGRRRPDYDLTAPDTNDSDSRKSFFSGHGSMTLATTTYLGLYLYGNVFEQWRAPGSALAWWELFPYAGLAAISVYVPASRVSDNRHNGSDVITGALVGASMSIGFYAWQELRHQRGRSEQRGRLVIVPAAAGMPGAAVAGWF